MKEREKLNGDAIKAVVLLGVNIGSAFHYKLIQNIKLLEKILHLSNMKYLLMTQKLEVVTPLHTIKKSCFSILPDCSATLNSITSEVP